MKSIGCESRGALCVWEGNRARCCQPAHEGVPPHHRPVPARPILAPPPPAAHLGGAPFPRVKVGIGRPPGSMPVHAYVLQVRCVVWLVGRWLAVVSPAALQWCCAWCWLAAALAHAKLPAACLPNNRTPSNPSPRPTSNHPAARPPRLPTARTFQRARPRRLGRRSRRASTSFAPCWCWAWTRR